MCTLKFWASPTVWFSKWMLPYWFTSHLYWIWDISGTFPKVVLLPLLKAINMLISLYQKQRVLAFPPKCVCLTVLWNILCKLEWVLHFGIHIYWCGGTGAFLLLGATFLWECVAVWNGWNFSSRSRDEHGRATCYLLTTLNFWLCVSIPISKQDRLFLQEIWMRYSKSFNWGLNSEVYGGWGPDIPHLLVLVETKKKKGWIS